jgi:hypothetical protein
MQILRVILELLYFLSGPALALFALFGLRQLTIAKENAKMSAMRDSYKLAADQVAFFGNIIIPLKNKLDEAVSKNNITVFGNAKYPGTQVI